MSGKKIRRKTSHFLFCISVLQCVAVCCSVLQRGPAEKWYSTSVMAANAASTSLGGGGGRDTIRFIERYLHPINEIFTCVSL